MTENLQGSSNIDLDYFAAKISELLSDTVSALNLEEACFTDIPLGVIITDHPKGLLDGADGSIDEGSVYIFLFEKGSFNKHVYHKMSLAEFDRSIRLSIQSGGFLAWALKDILRKLKLEFLAKYKGKNWIMLTDLFNNSNSVIFKGEKPILVVSEKTTRPFYMLAGQPDKESAKPKIFMDFTTDAKLASLYPEPKSEIEKKDEALKIVFLVRDIPDLVFLKLKHSENHSFTVDSAFSVTDYMGSRKVMRSHYNDSDRILSGIIDAQSGFNALELLDLIP